MMHSMPIDEASDTVGCASDGGAYYVSKSEIMVEVGRYSIETPSGGSEFFNQLDNVDIKRKPDRDHGYCLDYAPAATAADKVYVKKTANYLLQTISTQAIDQSAYIITSLISAGFRGIAGLAGGGYRADAKPVKVGTAFRAEYDPFDVERSVVVNEALTHLGFCLILEDQTFDTNRLTVEQYCNDPQRALASVQAGWGQPYKLGGRRPPGRIRQAPVTGILYRPRVPYNYYLFVKRRERGRVRWKLRKTSVARLENKSPILAVGVDRTYFATRRTSLIFDEGSLKNICIYKSSELEQIAEIPFSIANNLVALPTNILKLRLENTNNFAKLAKVEQELIATQRKHLDVLRGVDDAVAPADGAKDPGVSGAVANGVATSIADLKTAGLVATKNEKVTEQTWQGICDNESAIPENP